MWKFLGVNIIIMAASSKKQGGCEPGFVVCLVETSWMVGRSSGAAVPVLGPGSCGPRRWVWTWVLAAAGCWFALAEEPWLSKCWFAGA